MCYTPIQLKKETWKQKLSDTYHYQEVPCGRCIECRKMMIKSWQVRLQEELKIAHSAYFVTFTYDDTTIPFTENGLMTLNYEDLKKTWKKLRKYENAHKNNNLKIKYFAVGEYGSKTNRPHYHAILFNVLNSDNIVRAWNHGFTHVGTVTPQSIGYTLKYAVKRVGKEWWKPNADDDRLLEKSCISKALGINFITEAMKRYYNNNLEKGVIIDGITYPLPRYYRDKILTKNQKRIRNALLSDLQQERYDKKSAPEYPEKVKYLTDMAKKKSQKTD